MRKAFTLLELLVATMLLAMLVTILTMIFNQSSVAWTIGVASITDLKDARQQDAQMMDAADNAFLAENDRLLRVVSVWDDSGNVRTRACEKLSSGYVNKNDLRDQSGYSVRSQGLGSSGSGESRTAYIVGVTSWGPDGQQGTWDDITTMPEEVVK